MDWMSAAFWAWIGWNVLPFLAFIAIVAAFVVPGTIKRAWKQARCKHKNYHETRACDAICSACGLNLGFIGTVREARSPSPPLNEDSTQ